MRLSTKLLLAGLVGAGLVLTAGSLNERRLDRRLAELEKQCQAEPAAPFDSSRPWTTAGSTEPANPFDKYDDDFDPATAVLYCDAAGLWYRSEELTGIQKTLATTYRDKLQTENWSILAAGLLVISAVPWLWYFLLRRIGELRAAIRGNPPSN